MKNIIYAGLLVAALSLPAASAQAQSGTTTGMKATTGATTATTTTTTATMPDSVAVSNMTRAAVRKIQTSLRDNGFSPGKVDGIWGPRTAAAMQLFQQSHGISTANARMIGTDTLNALGMGLNDILPAAGTSAAPGVDPTSTTRGRLDDMGADRLEDTTRDW